MPLRSAKRDGSIPWHFSLGDAVQAALQIAADSLREPAMKMISRS
jgi:hypothetical protein